MGKKKVSFLFGVLLFLFIGINCMKAVSVDLIKEGFIGSAFSFRINDVIWTASPEMNINDAVDLQELMQEHPQLDKIIHQYLRAYAKYLSGNEQAFKNFDSKKSFKKMNQDILKETKKRTPGGTLAMGDQEFLAKVRLAEEEVESILQDTIPYNLKNFGKPAVFAISIYSFATSPLVQIGIILLLFAMVVKIYMLSDGKLKHLFVSFGRTFVIHGVFWLIIYGLIKLADWRLLDIVDRFLGRSMFADGSPFLWNAVGLVAVGRIFTVLSIHKAVGDKKMEEL